MKYMLTFIIGHCCSLHSSYLLSLCSKSGISATARSIAGTNLLESHVRWSAIAPQFSTESTAIWFLGQKSKPWFCLLLCRLRRRLDCCN